MQKSVVILSGGMDSTTLLYDVVDQGYQVEALSFNYNQKHKKELDCAKATCMDLQVPHEIIDLSILNDIAPSSLTRKEWDIPEGHYADENMKETVVPNRNMVMLSLATSYAISIGAEELFYGAHSGDHDIYPDCRKEFVEQLGKAISMCDWNKIELKAPYIDLDKGDIIIKGKELNVDYSKSWTCYKGKEKACGKCGSCVERLEAFEKADAIDPLEYE